MIKKFKLNKSNKNYYKNKKNLKPSLILNSTVSNSLNNLKKFFFYLNVLNKKKPKKYILIVGDPVLYKIFNYIFILKNKHTYIYKFKNIIFYNKQWVSGTISSRINFFKFLKKKIKLIVVFNSKRLYINNFYKELLKFKLPIVFFYNNKVDAFKNFGTYRILYNNLNDKFHLIFLISLLKISINEKI